MTFEEMMERARMEAWRKISPHSNLHSAGCDETCYDPAHYPDGDPRDDEPDMSVPDGERDHA